MTPPFLLYQNVRVHFFQLTSDRGQENPKDAINLVSLLRSNPEAGNESRIYETELLESVRQMKAGRSEKVHNISISPGVSARMKSGLSQSEFAKLLGVSARTLQNWEQGRREPSGADKTLIAIAERRPEVLREVSV